jgi:hypothetical protein
MSAEGSRRELVTAGLEGHGRGGDSSFGRPLPSRLVSKRGKHVALSPLTRPAFVMFVTSFCKIRAAAAVVALRSLEDKPKSYVYEGNSTYNIKIQGIWCNRSRFS